MISLKFFTGPIMVLCGVQNPDQMPVFKSEALLQSLIDTVRAGIQRVELLKTSESAFGTPGGGWSTTQHLYHLNFYASFYTEAIEACLDQAKGPAKTDFRSGWLGNYFTNIIGPAEENQAVKVKMKSPENAVPPGSEQLDLSRELEAYLGFQHRLLYLLQRAQHVDIGAYRVPTSLSKFIRLKLGDTFRFVIAHQERHLQHMQRAGQLV